jgi:N-acetylglucosamine-6-phosphate deacetylase
VNEAEDRVLLHLLDTERSRPELADLDLLPTEELVALMCEEIRRLPDALEAAQGAIARTVEGVVESLAQGGRLIYVGAGTAGRLGLLDAAEAGPTFNVPEGQVIGVLAGGSNAFDVAVENAEDDRDGGAAAIAGLGIGTNDAVVGIAASGRTPFVLGALESAKAAGAFTVALVCNPGTPLAALAQLAIEVEVGAEVVAGSTRLNAGTAQKIVLNIISTAAMVKLGKTYGALMIDLRATNAKLRDRAARIVSQITGAELDQAQLALERCDWRPKVAAAALVGGLERDDAVAALARHKGMLRPTLAELAPTPSPRPPGALQNRRLGVGAALVDGMLLRGDVEVVARTVSRVGVGRGVGEQIAIPALVDAQVNGYSGIDLLAAGEEEMRALAAALLHDGVTAFQPTLISSSEQVTLAALRRIARVAASTQAGATITGVHLEGPFLAPARAGTHPREWLRAPDRDLLERLIDAGPVRTVTLAPELPGALELVALCARRGIVVSLGHSDASAGEAAAGFAAGASTVTHLFNAMAPLSARAPGLAGAALASHEIELQIIADGTHVSAQLLRLVFAAAAGRTSLVSDAIAAAGVGDGVYQLGSVEVTVRNGVARRGDGTLAGSSAPLAEGLRTLGRLGIDLRLAAAAASANPARLLGRSDLGRLAPGRRADILVIDEDFSVNQVLQGGRVVERG